jgi:hypothetical protein
VLTADEKAARILDEKAPDLALAVVGDAGGGRLEGLASVGRAPHVVVAHGKHEARALAPDGNYRIAAAVETRRQRWEGERDLGKLDRRRSWRGRQVRDGQED